MATYEQKVLLLDLVPDDSLIAEYVRCHARGNVPAPIIRSIREEAGIVNMRIYRLASRLCMVMDVDPERYNPAAKASNDANDPVVQEWETRMGRYQRPVPSLDGSEPGAKWQEAELIFNLQEED